MADKDLEKLKEVLKKHGYDSPTNDLYQIQKSIEALASLIKSFEEKKLKNKKHGR